MGNDFCTTVAIVRNTFTERLEFLLAETKKVKALSPDVGLCYEVCYQLPCLPCPDSENLWRLQACFRGEIKCLAREFCWLSGSPEFSHISWLGAAAAVRQ